MTVSVTFDESREIAVRASGPVTYDQIHLALIQILHDARLRAGAAIFVDARGVTLAPSISDLAAAARDFAEVVGRGVTRLAVLSESEGVHLAARTFASFASVVGADAKGFFRDEQAARRWLRREGPGTSHPIILP